MHLNEFIKRFRLGLMGLMAAGLFIIPAHSSAEDAPKAASQPPANAAPEQAKPVSSAISVESVDVAGAGDKVVVKATGPLKYTVFKLSEPSRIVVDMPGVNISKVSSPINVDNNFITQITVISYGTEDNIGRLVIGLKEGVAHDVKSGENSILVSLKADATPVAAVAPVPAPAPEVKPEAAPEPKSAAKSASKITKIEVAQDGGNTVITVVADGSIGNYNSFALDNPSRIIVDVWGVTNATGQKTITAKESKFVKIVRFGDYKDKARLVIDLSGKKVTPYAVNKDDSSLVMIIGEGAQASASEKAVVAGVAVGGGVVGAPAVPVSSKETTASSGKKAAPAATEVAEAKAVVKEAKKDETSLGSEIGRVDFRIVNGKGRLTVMSSAKTPYTVKESEDGKTLMIDIKDATIPDDLVRTLDAVKLATPVATISSYQESFKPKDVRVLVKLNEKSSYEVKDLDGTITVEFASAVVARPADEKGSAALKAEAADTKEYAGKKIDLDMMDASISDVLRLLAEVSNVNIIASDEVRGNISLRLKNVPWEQAFDIILKAKELDKSIDGNVIRVAPATKLRQEREALLAAKKAQEKLENLEISYITVNYGDASALEPQVKGVLTERGSVTSEKRTNIIIVKDIKQGIEQAVNLVKKLDTIIPQVLIEARIVEASTSFARDLGIQWGVDTQLMGTFGHNSTNNVFGATTASGAWAGDLASRVTSTNAATSIIPTTLPASTSVTNYAVNLPATGTAGPLGALGFLFGKAGRNPLLLDLRLSAGESEGRVRTISRPRITTMDNKEAKIEQGESIPFSTTSSSGTSTTFIDANLSLTVTPHITPDGSVLMKIKASRNSIGTFRTSSGEPSINKKESQTEVLVRDGETTVIGGIIVSDKSETEKGIPFLKDIPLIGWFFKSKSVSDNQTELLIFITPTIMKDKVLG
ncbi:type IV pilus secretin family protein [bacterium]|nr:MAG: type IV pilus secretin family protein [bacterium]